MALQIRTIRSEEEVCLYSEVSQWHSGSKIDEIQCDALNVKWISREFDEKFERRPDFITPFLEEKTEKIMRSSTDLVPARQSYLGDLEKESSAMTGLAGSLSISNHQVDLEDNALNRRTLLFRPMDGLGCFLPARLFQIQSLIRRSESGLDTLASQNHSVIQDRQPSEHVGFERQEETRSQQAQTRLDQLVRRPHPLSPLAVEKGYSPSDESSMFDDWPTDDKPITPPKLDNPAVDILPQQEEEATNMALVTYCTAITNQVLGGRTAVLADRVGFICEPDRKLYPGLAGRYEARVDGCVIRNHNLLAGNPSEEGLYNRVLSIKEVKPHERDGHPEINRQEAGQLAAWICRCPTPIFTFKGGEHNGKQMRLHISQDKSSIFLNFAIYDERYQQYLQGKSFPRDLLPVMDIHHHGPFVVTDPRRMRTLETYIIAYFIAVLDYPSSLQQ